MNMIQLELPGMIELYTGAAAPPAQEYVCRAPIGGPKLLCAPEDLAPFTAELGRTYNPLPSHVNVDPDDVERGLSQLVLTVIELLRQLMERQALRRMEDGTIDDEQVERLGQAFLKLEQRMAELKEIFGLSDEDLNIDLGPLGKLM